ncbi:hypothetical protein QAD02_004731 [Eretmocerus hayati]|uniref:Uncharacterized protein n=1 Tax=Eretmocerus hayati TaxID=131215 RepID=A0ACC2NQU6_9HYME|nr:hypothetical protein QAD02_004731 [Eretmocerus hayati]
MPYSYRNRTRLKGRGIQYSQHVHRYHNQKMGALEPHVFALAEAAYRSLKDTDSNQSCVISGESGAGKTETTKFILQYLCSVTSNVDTWVEQQILEANTILEAFGNAKTVRNDNSSRFGKFMQVCFDNKWMIKGCIIQDYLLEQSRITFQSSGERNYHVFYQLCEAASRDSEFAQQYKLKQASHYKYLTQSREPNDDLDDFNKFDALRLAFNVLQVPSEMCEGIFRVLSAILWLGNLTFQDVDGERCELTPEDREILESIAPLLGLQLEDLTRIVLQREINVRGNITEIPLKFQEAKENRHAMSKALYSRTFAWLINHINNCTNPGQDISRFLGVLDIFGFENFDTNSFEQLCINYTNEKLHKFFNHYVFALEQELYRQEEIQYSHITFTDNTLCLELIEKPPRCVLKLLTEQCHMPKGSDLAYLTNLHAEFESHPCYVKGDDRRKWEKQFGLKHYAGSVTYTVEGFVDKNRDVQQDVFFDFMSRSTNEFVQEITAYQDLLGCTVARTSGTPAATLSRGTSKGKPTLCDSFRHQLQALVDVLQGTTPWYARCIKPNMDKRADFYDEKLVLDQLRYLGMLDIIRIRKEGFPIHMGFSDFVARYRCLEKNRRLLPRDDIEAVKALIRAKNVPNTEWQIGKNKIFLRKLVHEPLEDARNQMLTLNAVLIQKIWRGYVVRKDYKRTREAALCVQHAYRGWKSRILFLRKRRAAIVIQSHLRGVFAREVAAALREMRRVDEEMRKRERLEEERRLIEDKKALEESQSDSDQYNGIIGMEPGKAQEEIAALSQMAEQYNSKMANHINNNTNNSNNNGQNGIGSDNQPASTIDLDNLFSFLSDAQSTKSNQIIEEIGEKMNELVEDLDVELESVIQAELEKNAKLKPLSNYEDKSLVNGQQHKKGPSLPEPTEPPPPPPPPPQFANGDVMVEEVRKRKEPIYESVLPRDDIGPPVPLIMNGNGPAAPNGDLKPEIPAAPVMYPAKETHLEPKTRRKFRVERKLQELEEKKQEAPEGNENYHDIVEFAQNYFNSHERSPEGTIMATLTRKSRGSKNMEYIPKYEMVTYHKGSTIPSSHIHMYDPDNVNVACTVFRDLCKYLRGEMKLDQEITAIQSIIGFGIEREELRDEILVQCMRQSTNNPNAEWAERVWLLLCLAIVAFQPSKLLYKYFVSFLKKNLALEGKLRQYVQWCLDNCKNTKVSCRQYPPSTVEIAAMRRLGTIVCRFFFLDGRTKAIDVHPTDTAADAAAKLAEKLGLRSLEGWAIYQSRPDGEEHVRAHDYLYDVIAAWEMKQCKLNTSNNGFSTLRRNNQTLGSGDNRFIFKRRLFRNTKELSQDPVEVNMLYAQAVYNVVKCDDFPVSEKVALQLAGLQAQVMLGDPKDNDRLDYYSEIETFLPYRISRARGDDVWVPILAQAHRQYGSGRTELTAKVLYLSCVMQYPLYGSTMFNVTYRGYWSYGNQLILGINCEGLMLIKPDDKFVLSEYRYQDVESIMLDPSDSFITISLLRHNPEGAHKCFVFETPQKTEIGSLIVSYCPALAGWITENEVPTKKLKGMTNEDRVRLYHNLVNCRRTLVDSEALRKPQDAGSNFFRNTLRRLSKHRIEKLRQEAGNATDQGETYKGFHYGYWAFSRTPITQSLTKLPDAEEQVALNVFQLILTYAGLGQNGDQVRRAEDEHVNLIQTMMERCMRKESLLGEMYLQLIKQTTDHPDPNSRVNLRHWALLSLACSVILPPQKIVRRYLITHLKRCASDYVTEEGKYARFAEKCLSKTQGTIRRQWPPSREEIMCTINRRPLYARFHFMDGQYHAIEFHPSATARDVMALIKEKIGLGESAMGYAIYEVLGNSERSLVADEKIAEVMSKWEKYRNAIATSQGSQPRKHVHHFFLFKKHLFLDQYMNLDDPVEKELLYHQVLHDLRADRFPITEKEAMMLSALQAQLELGDCEDHLTVLEYQSIAGHCLPARLVPNLCLDGVVQHHQSCRGMTQPEAKKAFLNLIQSWPLHKATIFDVMQSFTSNWPRLLWLAIDQKGLHLLEHRSRNALCTYDYVSILSYSPNANCLMIITGSDKKQSKVILTTSQAYQIATLIREYMEVLQIPMEMHKRDSAMVQQMHQVQPQNVTGNNRNNKSRPSSALHRGAPIIHSQAS